MLVVGVAMLASGLILLLITMILSFVWRILDIIDELSGRRAKRQIKRLKELNTGTGNLGSISSNELYEVIHSGNLVWSGVDGGKSNIEDFDSEVQSEGSSEVIKNEVIENEARDYAEDGNTSSVTERIVLIKELTSLRMEVQG